jgi:hypothetical protein
VSRANGLEIDPPHSSQAVRANATPHERKLWRALKELGIRFFIG